MFPDLVGGSKKSLWASFAIFGVRGPLPGPPHTRSFKPCRPRRRVGTATTLGRRTGKHCRGRGARRAEGGRRGRGGNKLPGPSTVRQTAGDKGLVLGKGSRAPGARDARHIEPPEGRACCRPAAARRAQSSESATRSAGALAAASRAAPEGVSSPGNRRIARAIVAEERPAGATPSLGEGVLGATGRGGRKGGG